MRIRVPRPLLYASVAAAILLAGCEERMTMPADPSSGAPDGGSWTTLDAPAPDVDFQCLWALDADDVWVGASDGWVLRWNGETLTHHRSPASAAIADIGGTAWNDVWALAGNRLLHWDGRTWRDSVAVQVPGVTLDPSCLHVDPAGMILVGGLEYSWPLRGVVLQHGDLGWKRWHLDGEGDRVVDLRRPRRDGPVLAVTDNPWQVEQDVFVFTGSAWEWLPVDGEPRATHGNLVVTGDDDGNTYLYDVRPDGRQELLCRDVTCEDLVIDTRHPVVTDYYRLVALVDCAPVIVGDTDGHDLRDVAVPVRPGHTGATFFATTEDDRLLRFHWTADHRVAAVDLTDILAASPAARLVGDGSRHFALDQDGHLVTRDGTGWRRDHGARFELHDLRLLEDGSLLVWNAVYCRVGRRFPDGAWTWYPQGLRRTFVRVWCDPESGDLFTLEDDAKFMVYRDGGWIIRDTLGGQVRFYDAVAPDRHYAVLAWPGGEHRIAMFDGATWRDVTPPGLACFDSGLAAQTTRRFVARLRFRGDGDRLLAHDGHGWEVVADPAGAGFHLAAESATGDVYTVWDGTVRRLDGHGWEIVADLRDGAYPGGPAAAVWVGGDATLLVLDRSGGLHRRPLPSH